MPVAAVEDDAFNRSKCEGTFKSFTSAKGGAFAAERSLEFIWLAPAFTRLGRFARIDDVPYVADVSASILLQEPATELTDNRRCSRRNRGEPSLVNEFHPQWDIDYFGRSCHLGSALPLTLREKWCRFQRCDLLLRVATASRIHL